MPLPSFRFLSDDRHENLARRDHVVDGNVLGGGVLVDHPGGHGDTGDAFGVEEVAIGAASALPRDDLEPQRPDRPGGLAVGALGFFDVVGPVDLLGLEVDRRPMTVRQPRSSAERIASNCASSFSWSWLRAMPWSMTSPGTMFLASPPVMVPMLATVSSSMRPSGMAAMASAATFTALMPFSGSTPAWTFFP